MDKKEILRQIAELEKLLCVKEQVNSAEDLWPKIKKYGRRKTESFIVITLDGAHKVIKIHEVTKGIANKTLVHPREVFAPAIADRAVAIVVGHNHPSGSAGASEEDKLITLRLQAAGSILAIPVLDSIIITKHSYSSGLSDGWYSNQGQTTQ